MLSQLNNKINLFLLQNKIIFIIKVYLIFYIILLSSKPSKDLFHLFENFYFRLLFILFIFYSITIDIELSILLIIFFVIGINDMVKKKREDLLNINTINYFDTES